MTTFYISPNGDDSASGDSPDNAFETFARAQAAMRSSPGHDTMIVGGGTYVISAPIALTSADSDSTFVAADGEVAVVSGGGNDFSLFTVTGATNIEISGLTLTGVATDVGSPDEAPGGIITNSSSNIVIQQNIFDGLPMGLQLDDHSDHVTVANNTFTNIGGNGIDITALTHENTITNNTLTHIGFQWDIQTAAISMGETWGNIVSHNVITDAANFGIGEWNYSSTRSGGNTIEYNVISKTGQIVNDTGSIYIFSSEDNQALGTTIRYNSINDSGPSTSWGIYLDDLTDNAEVYGNFVSGASIAGVMIHGGNNNEVYNNVIVNSGKFGVELLEIGSASMAGNSVHHNLVETPRDAGSQLISLERGLADPTNFHDNVFVSPNPAPLTGDGTWAQWTALGGDEGSDVVTSAGFVDPGAGNYAFKADAFALSQGITQLPWNLMGPTGGTTAPPPPVEPPVTPPAEPPVTPPDPVEPPVSPPPPVEPPAPDDEQVSLQTLTLVLSGDAYLDRIDPEFIVNIDGVQVGGGSVDVDHNDGQKHSETFSFSALLTEGPHVVEIGFINDNAGPPGRDINLEIQEVRWNGASYGPDPGVTLRDNGWFTVNVDR